MRILLAGDIIRCGGHREARTETSGDGLVFLAALTIDGALAGVIYATIALAFVVVYKASRTINFALGEWIMLGSRMVATGLHAFGLGLVGALGVAIAGMVVLAVGFNRVVVRPMIGRPTISLIMVTIGFGALVRGAATLGFSGISPSIALPIGQDPIMVIGVPVAPAKLVAAAAADPAMAGWGVLAVGFNRVVVRPMIGRPTISLIMVTIGFGALVRGAATLGFSGISPSIALPIGQDPIMVIGVPVAPAKLVAAAA